MLKTHIYKRILLVYPSFPSTYWGMQYILPVLGRKAIMPPLGLITIAAMFPEEIEFKLVDLNCEALLDDDLAWADIVFLSAMYPQKKSLATLASKCKEAGKQVVVGGPFPTSSPDECQPYADVVVQGEAESLWPEFLADFMRGELKPQYASLNTIKPDITKTPIPRFDLLNFDYYMSIPIQYSRGCPFLCEFCDIIIMYGRVPRTKTPEQICAELAALFQIGYRGDVFIVDDNFIGNIPRVKELLPVMEKWNQTYKSPFIFGTEATINLAEHEDLMRQMVNSGFRFVFLGIETPSKASLKETLKFQNMKGSLNEYVLAIANSGLLIAAGFIIGFDNDNEDIFDRQIAFISQTAIPFAMVGLLIAIPGTPLFDRMKKAGRLDGETFPDDLSDQCGYTNIKTIIPRKNLLEGYRYVMQTIYTPRHYFERVAGTIRRMLKAKTFSERLLDVKKSFRTSLQYLDIKRIGFRAAVKKSAF